MTLCLAIFANHIPMFLNGKSNSLPLSLHHAIQSHLQKEFSKAFRGIYMTYFCEKASISGHNAIIVVFATLYAFLLSFYTLVLEC